MDRSQSQRRSVPRYWDGYHLLSGLAADVCRGTAKQLLLELHARQGDNPTCWMSVAFLCRSLGRSRRTVQRHLKSLTESQLVLRRDRQGSTCEYSIHWPVIQAHHQARPTLFRDEARRTQGDVAEPLSGDKNAPGECQNVTGRVTKMRPTTQLSSQTKRPLVCEEQKPMGEEIEVGKEAQTKLTADTIRCVVRSGDLTEFRRWDATLAARFNWPPRQRDGLGERDRLALWHRSVSGRFRDGKPIRDAVGMLLSALKKRDRRYINDDDIEWAAKLLKRSARLSVMTPAEIAKTANALSSLDGLTVDEAARRKVLDTLRAM